MTTEDVMDMPNSKEFRHRPVVNNLRLIGVVLFRDMLRWIAQSTKVE